MAKDGGSFAGAASAKRYVALAATETGTANMAFTTSFSAQWELLNLTIKFSADAENDVLLTLDANAGSVYDAQFVALAAFGLTKLWYDPKEDSRRMLFTEDDELLVSWTNPSSLTYGLRIVARRLDVPPERFLDV